MVVKIEKTRDFKIQGTDSFAYLIGVVRVQEEARCTNTTQLPEKKTPRESTTAEKRVQLGGGSKVSRVGRSRAPLSLIAQRTEHALSSNLSGTKQR